MRTPHRLLAVAASCAAAVALAGCGLHDSEGSVVDDRPMTHRALAAAVIDHVGQDASAAAALFPRDGVQGGSIGVEVAFPVEGHDATHVRVVVSAQPRAFRKNACDLRSNRYLSGCEEETTGDGADTVDTVLSWEQEAPEEDPGVIYAVARHQGWLVSVYAYGPHVPADLGDLRDFADDLVALAADPAVGYRTTSDYAAAGADIADDVWLDWYGQGNGYPPPKGYRGSGG